MGKVYVRRTRAAWGIFKIDRPFVERMRARGLNDLTLAKLIKIKIFKVDH